MFSDPSLLYIDASVLTLGTQRSFARTGNDKDKATYGFIDTDGNKFVWSTGHQYGKRARFTSRLDVTGLTPDLLIDGNNSQFSQAIYVVCDVPISGPVNTPSYSNPTLIESMLKTVGFQMVAASATDPSFMRIINGEL
jgi:hypothetical protein